MDRDLFRLINDAIRWHKAKEEALNEHLCIGDGTHEWYWDGEMRTCDDSVGCGVILDRCSFDEARAPYEQEADEILSAIANLYKEPSGY